MAKKSPTGSLPPVVPLAITPTFRPWTHTSDDSYFYQLSFVVATATVSFVMRPFFAFRQKSLFLAGRTSVGCQKENKNNHFSVPGMFLCVIQHRNWPLTSTILNAHGTNASPDGLCTRTHTNEAFSCWFCCNSFRVDRARRGNVCLEDQAKACSPTDQPVRKFRDGLDINITMKKFFTFRTE